MDLVSSTVRRPTLGRIYMYVCIYVCTQLAQIKPSPPQYAPIHPNPPQSTIIHPNPPPIHPNPPQSAPIYPNPFQSSSIPFNSPQSNSIHPNALYTRRLRIAPAAGACAAAGATACDDSHRGGRICRSPPAGLRCQAAILSPSSVSSINPHPFPSIGIMQKLMDGVS
jgi:hypothetical protein